MPAEIDEYVKFCLVSKQDKAKQQRLRGLLKPLVLTHTHENVFIDFIMALPIVYGCGSIIVVVRFSKYNAFILLHNIAPETVAHLFLTNVVKLWGVPQSIFSDKDSRFTWKFWMELFNLLDLTLHFSSRFHPQSDRQTERMNSLLEC